jgi:hypothetical protein
MARLACCSRISLRSIRATIKAIKKGSGTPTDACSNLPCSWHGRCPPPYPPPHAGEDKGGGSSPVGVPPRFSLGEYSIPKLRLQARLPGTRQERRSVTFPLPEAASGAVVAGVTRPNLSQSSGSTPPAGRNAGLHDARSRPGADCVVPPAGTALAPHNREHPRDGVPYRARFAMRVTEMVTNVNEKGTSHQLTFA